MGVQLENINALAELERYGIKFEFAGGDEVKCLCPFHDDSSPSCHVNTLKRLFQCHTAGCKANGDIVDLLARYTKVARAIVLVDLAQHYDLEDEKLIDPQTVERFHENIWKAGPLLRELYARGVTDDMIRRYRFGEEAGRITIPIRNRNLAFVNIRKYLPGAPGKDKMKNSRGFGAPRWFPIEQLSYQHIVLVGGECKAIVGADQLNKHGYGCITVTAGEKSLPIELLADLKDKIVYVIMDIDEAGRKAAKDICLQIRVVAEWVSNILLPLDTDKHPKGDINDFIATEHGELLPLLLSCEEFVPDFADKLEEDTSEPIEMELCTAIRAENANKRIKVNGTISAMVTTPYLVPKDVLIECDEGQPCCAVCPVFLQSKRNFTIPSESESLLEFVDTSKLSQLEVVKATVGIPRTCKVCSFEKLTEYNIEYTFVSPQLDLASQSGDRQPVPAYCLGTGLQLNESYELTGKLYAHPKTQQATLLISSHKTAQNALSTYTLNEAENLAAFWPTEWTVEAIQEKLDHIYSDIEANVTHIFKRRDMHLLVDLTMHSMLFIEFDGKTINGWVDSMIMGDSGHGKTEVPKFLMQHYNLGMRFEGGNSSVAGVLGGMEKMGDRFLVSWGVIPCNDRRFVHFDEVKDTPIEILGKLTDMRSEGVAQITKIGKHWQTYARTRQLWTSNPRSDMKMAQYTFGVKAILELIGQPEDVRRFDFVLLVADSEIDPEEVNQLQSTRPTVEHCYSANLCRQLVLWSWTRKKGEIKFTDEAIRLTLASASQLCNLFSDVIPLVNRGSMRYKIAKLAAALAARLFSCSEDFSTLIVYPCHVEYIVQWITRIYGSKVFGYTEFTAAQKLLTELLDPEELKTAILQTSFPTDFCKSLLSRDYIEFQDLADWTAWERPQVMDMLSLFVRKHAFTRSGRAAYRKTSLFIEFLKNLLEDDNFGKGNEPPQYMNTDNNGRKF